MSQSSFGANLRRIYLRPVSPRDHYCSLPKVSLHTLSVLHLIIRRGLLISSKSTLWLSCPEIIFLKILLERQGPCLALCLRHWSQQYDHMPPQAVGSYFMGYILRALLLTLETCSGLSSKRQVRGFPSLGTESLPDHI